MTFDSLTIPPQFKITQEQFEVLTQVNRDLQLEKTATGELIIMPPTEGNTGRKNLEIEGQLWLWNRQTGLGIVFNSSTGFYLPNTAIRSPDVAWVSQQKWQQLTPQQQDQFPPLCPDFVVELRPKTDRIEELQKKMQKYLDNGLRLGWLINPQQTQVEVYRQNQEVEVLDFPVSLSGEDILPGFVLDMRQVW